MRYLIFIISLTLLSALSGCATITTGTSQSVTVMTEKKVEGADCELTDSQDGKWFVKTPGTVSVRKGYGPMTITCKKEEYHDTTTSIDETFAGATLGNLLIGGGIGLLVDAASGSAQRYPDQIVVWMEPVEWLSDAERQAWVQEKQTYEEKLKRQNTPQNNNQVRIGL